MPRPAQTGSEPRLELRSHPPLPTQTEIILNSIADGVFTVDLNWRVTFFNQAAEEIIGLPAAEALGRPCCEVFRANVCESACVLRHTLETGQPVMNQAIAIFRADGKEIPISVSTALLKDETGAVIGGVETFRDLSLVEELRREIHRRYRLEDILSKSPLMQKIFTLLPEVARSDSTVLHPGGIRHRQGTGGAGDAQLSRRAKGPSLRSTAGRS